MRVGNTDTTNDVHTCTKQLSHRHMRSLNDLRICDQALCACVWFSLSHLVPWERENFYYLKAGRFGTGVSGGQDTSGDTVGHSRLTHTHSCSIPVSERTVFSSGVSRQWLFYVRKSPLKGCIRTMRNTLRRCYTSTQPLVVLGNTVLAHFTLYLLCFVSCLFCATFSHLRKYIGLCCHILKEAKDNWGCCVKLGK